MRRASDNELKIVRRAYARQMLAIAGVRDDLRLERAFATVPREDFLRAGPWLVSRGVGYERVEADPVLAYQDVLIALKPEKQINNGSPSLHAQWMHAAALEPGERVAHIGAGAGYYSAILATLVGARGRVMAVEIDADLAEQARINLARYKRVSVSQGDGANWPQTTCDLAYVNFAVDRPAARWLDNLDVGGRLIFPLGSIARDGGRTWGAALRIERTENPGLFAARSLGGAYFVRAEGEALIATGAEREALLAAFERGDLDQVRSLRWRLPASKRCWHAGDGWSLGFDAPG